MATPSPDTPAQMPMARARSRSSWNTLVRIDRVLGKMQRAADAHERPGQRSACRPSWLKAASAENIPNRARPSGEDALAAELVAEGAGREQQAGEDDRVAVDQQLQLGAPGARGSRRSTAAPR